MSNKVTFADIWGKLSSFDVNKHIKTIGSGNFQAKYLSWAWAWGELMKLYPNSTYEFKDCVFYGDGSCETWVVVDIEGNKREMWLPVMDHKNNAVINPNSRQISDTRMRCLVKCLAMFGLGHYIYAGEDLPHAPEIEYATDFQAKKIEGQCNRLDAKCAALMRGMKVTKLIDLTKEAADKIITHYDKLLANIDTIEAIRDAFEQDDMSKAIECWMELEEFERDDMLKLAPSKGGVFSTEIRSKLPELEREAMNNG